MYFTILPHLIVYACTIVCMRTPLKRSPVYILMCAVFSWAILNKYMYYYYYRGLHSVTVMFPF